MPSRYQLAKPRNLICPKCGYNLTGSQSPQCPECGKSIDREKLATEQAKAMVNGDILWTRLLIPAGLCFLASTIPIASLYLMPLAAVALVIYGGISAWEMANRLALTRAVLGKPEGAGYRAFVGWTFVGLWLAHIALAAVGIAGGCTIALMIVSAAW